jgi:predicted CxxxxCH...CXXCH cytochrome family protein
MLRSKLNGLQAMECMLLIAVLLPLGGCGSSTPNSKAVFNSDSPKHSADWLPAGHMAAAQQDQSICAQCHGSDFLGGISRVSCTQCHIGGVSSKHPQDWTQDQVKVWGKHAAYVAGVGNASCANEACHGQDLGGVEGSGPSCTSCHLGGTASKHPAEWGDHAAALHLAYTLNNGGGKCATTACHGSDLSGVVESGPSCKICHNIPPHPLTDAQAAGCSTCHPANGPTSKMFHPWDAPTSKNHSAYATTTGTGSCAVTACHGTTLSGGDNCPSCTSCHLGGVNKVHPSSFGTGTTIITVHQTYVAQNTTSGCANAACHGSALTGGTSSAPSCTSCHLGGVTTKHPVDFGGTPALNHPSYVAFNGTAGCALAACHGSDLAGGVAGPSCSSCHLGGPTLKHPSAFGLTTRGVDLNHKAYINLNAVNGSDGMGGCRNGYCHGPLLTGVTGSGPACSTTQCHQAGSPDKPSLTPCASCHGKPPTGSAAPNRAGAHAKHNALAGVANVCDTCHSGSGTGTENHFNGTVNTQFLSAYNAKSGTATRNADGTCSKVSCHGGQTTPAWLTGTINVNAQCISCHAFGTSEYNSFVSGRHDFHILDAGLPCNNCHDIAKLAPNHFASLGTTALEGPASATLLNSLNYSGTSCYASCHPDIRTW